MYRRIVSIAAFALLTSCVTAAPPAAKSGLVPAAPSPAYGDAFWKHWGDGRAELAAYDLETPRYGEPRRGVAVAIFVTETFSSSLRVKADPGDLEGRLKCQIGAWQSMISIIGGVPMGASHAIGHILGGTCDVPHGYTSCVMSPYVLAWNAEHDASRQARTLALGTFTGAAQLAQQSDDPPATLRERVTSKGGTTAAALAVMEAGELRRVITEALAAAQRRGVGEVLLAALVDGVLRRLEAVPSRYLQGECDPIGGG